MAGIVKKKKKKNQPQECCTAASAEISHRPDGPPAMAGSSAMGHTDAKTCTTRAEVIQGVWLLIIITIFILYRLSLTNSNSLYAGYRPEEPLLSVSIQ